MVFLAECSPLVTQDGLSQNGRCSIFCPAGDSLLVVVSARGAAITDMALLCPAAAPPASLLACRSDGLIPDRTVRVDGPTGRSRSVLDETIEVEAGGFASIIAAGVGDEQIDEFGKCAAAPLAAGKAELAFRARVSPGSGPGFFSGVQLTAKTKTGLQAGIDLTFLEIFKAQIPLWPPDELTN